jgi:DNA-binding transcriptional MerR regulator
MSGKQEVGASLAGALGQMGASRQGALGQMMRIGELAQVTAVSAKTIRFYEETGVLPPAQRAANGYRQYDESDAHRLRFIRNARLLDFSLGELKEVLTLRERGEAPCVHVIGLLEQKMEEIEAQIRHLQELRGDLGQLLAEGEQLPKDDVQMEQCVCHLIRSR